MSLSYRINIPTFLTEVAEECDRSRTLHGPVRSLHEGYAVLFEEVDEFWDEVKLKAALRDKTKMRAELCQVAAVCLKIVQDLEL